MGAAPMHVGWRPTRRSFSLLLLATTGIAPSIAADKIAIADVTVIDGSGAGPVARSTVLLDDDRIAAVSPGEAPPPGGYRRIDGRGRFLIPGLWDMHVHLMDLGGARALPLFLAYGVTSIRDLGSNNTIFDLRQAVAAGDLLGPRIVAGGLQIRAWSPEGEEWERDQLVALIRTQSDALDLVSERQRRGSFVKIQDSCMPRELWLALADETRRQGLPLVGHIPLSIPLSEAVGRGLRSIEHVNALALAVSTEGERLRKLLTVQTGTASELWLALCESDVEAASSIDATKLEELARLLTREGAALDPNLIVLRAMAGASSGRWNDDPRLDEVGQRIRDGWLAQAGSAFYQDLAPCMTGLHTQMARLVGLLQARGVTVVAGTDTTSDIPFVFPGSGLHQELEELVAAGLTPMDALRAATSQAARIAGLGDAVGTVEVGKRADLILLEADPLIEIRNTRRIAAVIRGGTYLSIESLRSLAFSHGRN